jgi:VIT1/CCC1 family predicted Fe2+/Mn2+ transporter
MDLTADLRDRLRKVQRNEITEYHIYTRLARILPDPANGKVLERVGADELRHYHEWKSYTGEDVSPDRLKVAFYVCISRVFGFTFGVRLMEMGEGTAQSNYDEIARTIPEASRIRDDEHEHEERLLEMLDEERLHYAGSIVLGLNDALVGLTGALAGFTLALQNVRLIALTGMITGVAAAMSMASSEYLSVRAEGSRQQPVRAATYTGIAYILTVILLILPYLLFPNYYLDLAIALVTAVLIIAVFNYYISVATSVPFRPRFLEMAGISLGVAALSFGLGYLIRLWLGVDV